MFWERKKKKIEKQKMPTAKKIIIWLFVNCTIIELFTGYATIASISLARETFQPVDFSPLVTLIGAVIGEVIGYAVYAAKAAKENQKNGLTYELAMLEQQKQQASDNIIVNINNTPKG